MAIMKKQQYLEWLKKEQPQTFAKVGSDYDVIACNCGENFCKGFITRFSDSYQARYEKQNAKVKVA